MSTYYILVNKTKKEYLDAYCLGYTGKIHAYRLTLAPLVGFLFVCREWERNTNQFDPDKINDYKNIEIDTVQTLQGHWNNDDVCLVSEYDPLYKEIFDDNEGKIWIDISLHLAKEYNDNIDYIYDDKKIHDKLYFIIDKD